MLLSCKCTNSYSGRRSLPAHHITMRRRRPGQRVLVVGVGPGHRAVAFRCGLPDSRGASINTSLTTTRTPPAKRRYAPSLPAPLFW
ncbi:hypothetical protein QTP88_028658 [Uroleucon formosanum]